MRTAAPGNTGGEQAYYLRMKYAHTLDLKRALAILDADNSGTNFHDFIAKRLMQYIQSLT